MIKSCMKCVICNYICKTEYDKILEVYSIFLSFKCKTYKYIIFTIILYTLIKKSLINKTN